MPLLHFALAMLQLAGIEDLPSARGFGLGFSRSRVKGSGLGFQGSGV